MQKWEYLVTENAVESKLNRLGQEGWELVAVTFNDSGSSRTFYFKRPTS